MQGLEALLQVRRVAEEKALKALSIEQNKYERIREEEWYLIRCSEEARSTLGALEQDAFDIRDSIIYRRYLNMVRGRISRCRERKAKVKKIVDEKIKAYEKERHGREAIDDLIDARRAKERDEKEKQQQRIVNELAQQRWFRNKNISAAGKSVQ